MMRSLLSILLALVLISSAVALRPREEAPAFTAKSVTNAEFTTTSLEEYGDKWKVLLFYPFDFTFVW